MVMRDNTLSFFQKLIFCWLKIVCVTGFALGREYPEQRTRPPTLPPPIPMFAACEKRDGEEVKAGLSSEATEKKTESADAALLEKTESTDAAPKENEESTDAAPEKMEESTDATPKEKPESTVEAPKTKTEFQELTSASADVELRLNSLLTLSERRGEVCDYLAS